MRSLCDTARVLGGVAMQMTLDFETRVCNCCSVEKAVTDFGLTGGASGNRRKICKLCIKQRKLRRYHDQKANVNAKRKQDYYADRISYLKAAAASRKRNAAARSRYRKAYNQANPNRVRQWNQKRRARLLGVDSGSFTHAEITKQFNRQRGLCYYCGCVLKSFALDHIHPVSRGGRHYPENTVVACKPCNSSKWNFYIAEWKLKWKKKN